MIILTAILGVLFSLLFYIVITLGVSVLSHASGLPEQQASDFLAGQSIPYASLSVSITAIILSLLGSSTNLFRPSSGEEWAEHYYGKLPKQAKASDIAESDLPYLKALIRMKCRDFDLSLKDSYRKNVELKSDLFSEKRLLESLYANA